MKSEFNDPPQNYHPQEAPVTPYQKASAVWDERIGSAREQARNWRIIALFVSFIATILAGGLIYQSGKSTVTPYVVEVNSDGVVAAVGPARRTNYTPARPVIEYFLAQFVVKVRSLPLDPVVAKNQWLTAYAFLRQPAANSLNEIAIREQPFARLGEQTVSVQIRNVVPMSGSTYQVRWEEITYSREGVTNGSKTMTGIFTIEVSPPTDERKLKINPLGLYIRQFSWSRDV